MPVLERRRNPAVGGPPGGGLAPVDERAPAAAAPSIPAGGLGGSPRGPLRLSSAGTAGALDVPAGVPEGAEEAPFDRHQLFLAAGLPK
jgi:hypothetical protein